MQNEEIHVGFDHMTVISNSIKGSNKFLTDSKQQTPSYGLTCLQLVQSFPALYETRNIIITFLSSWFRAS